MHKLSKICITLFVEFVKDLVATISVVISLKLIKHICQCKLMTKLLEGVKHVVPNCHNYPPFCVQ